MKKKSDKATEPFFATTMQDMGGNIGHTPENEILWNLDDHKEAPPSYSK